MKISNFNQSKLCFCLTLLLVSSASYAEIYKWVDANGKTHYSERNEYAGKVEPVKLKVKSQPTSVQAADSSSQYWQEQETQFRRRQIQKQNEQRYVPSLAARPRSPSGSKSDEPETDASRCKLGRAVISGAVKHRNGAPTDKHDRETAENDIRAYCR